MMWLCLSKRSLAHGVDQGERGAEAGAPDRRGGLALKVKCSTSASFEEGGAKTQPAQPLINCSTTPLLQAQSRKNDDTANGASESQCCEEEGRGSGTVMGNLFQGGLGTKHTQAQNNKEAVSFPQVHPQVLALASEKQIVHGLVNTQSSVLSHSGMSSALLHVTGAALRSVPIDEAHWNLCAPEELYAGITLRVLKGRGAYAVVYTGECYIDDMFSGCVALTLHGLSPCKTLCLRVRQVPHCSTDTHSHSLPGPVFHAMPGVWCHALVCIKTLVTTHKQDKSGLSEALLGPQVHHPFVVSTFLTRYA